MDSGETIQTAAQSLLNLQSGSETLNIQSLDTKVVEMLLQQQTQKMRQDHEIKLKELEIRQQTEAAAADERRLHQEIERERLRNDQDRASPRPSSGLADYKGPKVPKFKEKETDIDAYLLTFERLAEVHAWEKDTWAIRLAPLLTGKALEAYSRMASEEAGNFDAVKRAILSRYELTSEAYRKKF
jgi:hypothetical protein